MLNPKALAVAVAAVGAGAVLVLSTGQDPVTATTPAVGPVPVAIPPAVSEVPPTHAAVPAAERVAAPSTAAPAPSVQSTSKAAQAKPAPATKAAPKRATVPSRAAVQQQPQPAGTEPNGTGGWQLPACYEESCVAQNDPVHGTGTEALNAGPFGLAGIVNIIPGLLGGH